MKFLPSSIKRCSPRVGILSEFERIPSITFETPLPLIYTRRGCVPHLTKDVFKMVTSEDQLLSVSLSSTILMVEPLKEIGTSFSHFVSMKEYINFLSIHDQAQAIPSVAQQSDSVNVWSRQGKYVLTVDEYMNIVETMKPDMYVALCDGDTNADSSKKRIFKAINRSETFLEKCLNRHINSEVLKSKAILGAVEGGYNLEARENSVNYLKDKPLSGYVIDGLHKNGPDVKDISSEQIKEVVHHTLNLLPIEKLKVSLGCWNPVTVLDLVGLGVDVFDTSYPYIISENSEALIFLCDHDCCNSRGHALITAEKRYADDFSPICKNCECLACKKHTRAYLHHLHNTKEMLGLVLLTIHNTHQYLKFFKAIRESLKNNTFNQYKQKISSKFPKGDN